MGSLQAWEKETDLLGSRQLPQKRAGQKWPVLFCFSCVALRGSPGSPSSPIGMLLSSNLKNRIKRPGEHFGVPPKPESCSSVSFFCDIKPGSTGHPTL